MAANVKTNGLPAGMDWRAIAARIREDPAFWMEACLKIRSKEGVLVPFRLNPFQRRLVDAVMDSLRERGRAFFVILKGRQLGISTVCPLTDGALPLRLFPARGRRCAPWNPELAF